MTLLSKACTDQVPISIQLKLCLYLVSFLRYSASKNGVTLKPGVGIVQGHWKWRRSIHHIRLYDRRARHSGLYHTDRPTVAQLAEDADDTLVSSVTHSSHHLLHVLLPEHTNHPYHLRSRTHSFKLSVQHDDRHFIDRMLFREAYSVCVWMLSLFT